MKSRKPVVAPINRIFNTCDSCKEIITKKNTTHKSFCNYCNSCYQDLKRITNSNKPEKNETI